MRHPKQPGKQLLISDNCWNGVSSADPGLQTPWCFSYREEQVGEGEAAERDFQRLKLREIQANSYIACKAQL